MAAVVSNQLNKVPTSLEPISTFGDKRVPTTVENVWYLFFQSLSSVLSNLVDGVLGFTTESGVEATGNSQATAFPVSTEWVQVSDTPAGSGILLLGFGPGVPCSVFNNGVNALDVYPPVGSGIDALGVNIPYSLAVGKMQVFSQVTETQFESMKLG